MKTFLTAGLLLVTSSAAAETIYRCLGSEGEPVFTNYQCEGAAEPVELGRDHVLEGSVSLTGARDQLHRLRSLPELKAARRPAGPKKRLGFGERAELRQLEIRADGLRRDLNRPRSRESRREMERELAAAASRIRELKNMASR